MSHDQRIDRSAETYRAPADARGDGPRGDAEALDAGCGDSPVGPGTGSGIGDVSAEGSTDGSGAGAGAVAAGRGAGGRVVVPGVAARFRAGVGAGSASSDNSLDEAGADGLGDGLGKGEGEGVGLGRGAVVGLEAGLGRGERLRGPCSRSSPAGLSGGRTASTVSATTATATATSPRSAPQAGPRMHRTLRGRRACPAARRRSATLPGWMTSRTSRSAGLRGDVSRHGCVADAISDCSSSRWGCSCSCTSPCSSATADPRRAWEAGGPGRRALLAVRHRDVGRRPGTWMAFEPARRGAARRSACPAARRPSAAPARRVGLADAEAPRRHRAPCGLWHPAEEGPDWRYRPDPPIAEAPVRPGGGAVGGPQEDLWQVRAAPAALVGRGPRTARTGSRGARPGRPGG